LQAYAAWLGFYNSAKGMGWDKPTLVQQANRFAGAQLGANHAGLCLLHSSSHKLGCGFVLWWG